MNPDTYIAPVFNRLLDKAERHIKYIISTSSYVQTLQMKREVLNARINDINGIINEGERRSQRPTNEVTVWQIQAVRMLDRMDAAVNIAEETGSCVCSICSKHKVGHSCDDMIREVVELLERASLFQNAEMVDCDTSNIAVLMPYAVEEFHEPDFADLLTSIEGDTDVNIIGIWGPPGVGKTTWLTKIQNYFVQTSSIFETVIWTVASREQSDVARVQSEIVKKLKLKEDNDVQSQADLINKYLKNKNFLLLMDDLWEHVALEKVGVPNLNEGIQCGKRRKVVFTTRNKEVCGDMEAKRSKKKCLDPTQSWTLFANKVGQKVIHSHPDIKKLAEDIAEECKGLPVALVTIGRAMSTKSNIDDWKSTLFLLKNSQGHHVLGVDKKLFTILRTSYDYLATEQLKKCFLTISLWPEDDIIGRKQLIEFWMRIDLIDNFESKYEAYQIGRSLVRKLQDACLLEDTEDDGIKMHDVLRDLAIWLGSNNETNKNKWMVKAGLRLRDAPKIKEKWGVAECISLMYNEIKELPSDLPTCPYLLTLLLGGNRLTGISCFGKFHGLNHLDLSGNSLDSFPESICDLVKLRYLNLAYNKITNLPMKLQNLKMLRYLVLRSNRIRNIPRGAFSELAEILELDMFLAIDTSECPSVDVEELKSIHENLLSFGTSVGSEEELSKLMSLSKLPLVDLYIEGLVSTTFHLLAVIRDPHRLLTLHIEDCASGLMEIVIDKNGIDQDFASLNLEILWLSNLKGLKRISWKDIAPGILFAKLRSLDIHGCPCIEDITWIIYLQSLKVLTISGCRWMKVAINNDVDAQVLTFPSLQIFYLIGVDKLEKISTHTMAFPELKELYVADCPLLKSLPFEVETTPKLRTIIGEKEWWEEVEWGDDHSSSRFNQFFHHC